MTPAGRDFLGELPEAHRKRLLGFSRDASFAAGGRIFDEEGPADRFWVLRSGQVALDVHVPGRGSVVVETLGQGELLGWSWLFAPYRWHLGARAGRPVDAWEFSAPEVRAAIDAEPAFGLAVTRAVAQVAIGRRLQAARFRLLDLYGPDPGGAE